MARFSQAPGILDIELVFGDSFSALLTFTKNGVAWDLSTYAITAKTDSSGKPFTITAVDLVNGKFNLDMSAADTATLIADETWYLQFVLSGVVNTELTGTILEASR